MTDSSAYDLTLNDLKTAHKEGAGTADDKWKLFERRFDYGWKAFQYHAGQRYTAFNFFIVFVGILAGAYGTLFGQGKFAAAAIMAGIAALITLIFMILDSRNKKLVSIAEDVLHALEEDLLFQGYKQRRLSETLKTEGRQLGILYGQDNSPCNSHSKWFPLLQFLVLLSFAGGAWAGYNGFIESRQSEAPKDGRMILSCQPGTGEAVAVCTLIRE